MAPALTLTFDDGPDPTWTPRVLDALKEEGATAIFFVMALRAAEHPELIDRARAEGHAVEFHCTRHVRHTESTEQEVRDDTAAGLERLASIGVHPTRWRTPYGIVAPFTPEIAAVHGLELTGWSADSHDWIGAGAEAMLASIESDLAPGAVVLMHDGIGPGVRREDCGETVDLVHEIGELARRRELSLA